MKRKMFFVGGENLFSFVLSREEFFEMSEHGIHLVGILLANDQLKALLEDRSGAGQMIQVGDQIPGGFKVESITQDSVHISRNNKVTVLNWSN